MNSSQTATLRLVNYVIPSYFWFVSLSSSLLTMKDFSLFAVFAGTVLHSLDHSMCGSALQDPLWLDVKCSKFRFMAEIGRIVRVAFVNDLWGLAFHRSFHNSGHPFYEAVYNKAAKIDKDLADKMDTCIIK